MVCDKAAMRSSATRESTEDTLIEHISDANIDKNFMSRVTELLGCVVVLIKAQAREREIFCVVL
jgi:hypothetical protein